MGVYHLVSISDDELRGWRGAHDELLSNIGAAVVLACLDPESSGVAIRDTGSNSAGEVDGSSITVRHIGQHDGEDFAVWAWATEDAVCVADLEDEDLETLGKVVEAARRSKAWPQR